MDGAGIFRFLCPGLAMSFRSRTRSFVIWIDVAEKAGAVEIMGNNVKIELGWAAEGIRFPKGNQFVSFCQCLVDSGTPLLLVLA